MASLKEVKNRIKSVTSTRKITSAMKLVASSKLHRAQAAIERMLPYEQQLNGIMSRFIGEMEGEISSPFTAKRSVTRAVIVAYSSNSSLCGAFNSNVIKTLEETAKELKSKGVMHIEVLAIGAKVGEKAKKMGYDITDCHEKMLDHPQFAEITAIAAEQMDRYKKNEIDEVILIYNHFKSTSQQVLTKETVLPIALDYEKADEKKDITKQMLDYIIEPSKEELIESLIPKVLHLKFFTALLDSIASEHSARVIAMQTATDNADDLLHDLTLTYNKTRQAAITTEILDIVGGSFQ